MKIKKGYSVRKVLLTEKEYLMVMEFATRIGEKKFSTLVRKVLLYHAAHPEYDFTLEDVNLFTDIGKSEEITLKLIAAVMEAIKLQEQNGVDLSNVIERVNAAEENP